MKTSILFLTVTIVFGASSNATAKITEKRNITPNNIRLKSSRNNVFGVASIAGITNRNGRFSSGGGIKFYPGTDSFRQYFYPLELSSEKDFNIPLTVSAESDGRYASGSVHVNPGYVRASATASYRPKNRISYTPSSAVRKAQFTQQRPLKEIFFHHQPDSWFRQGNVDNWLEKGFFLGFPSPSPAPGGEMRNGWLNNDFNPFMNFWR